MWNTISVDIIIIFNKFIRFNQLFSMTFNRFYLLFALFLIIFKAFPKGGYVNIASSVTLLWSEGSTSSPVRYSYLSIFPDDNANVFAASLVISYCYHISFSYLILSLILMISFYVLSERFFLKRKGLYDATVASITKK